MSVYEVSDITTPTEAITIDGYTAGYAAGAAGGTVAPVIDGVPTISGTVAVGYTLTATPAPLPAGTEQIDQSWQWYADAGAIAGATSSTYALTLTEQGAVITVTQTETGDGTDSATSAGTAAVGAPVAPSSVLPPQISGTRGGTLTYLAGTYTGSAPITTAPAWQTSPIGAGTWSTVSTSATYDDSSSTGLDLSILETPTGPGGAGTAVRSQVLRGVLVTGWRDVTALTPYAVSDPNSTLASGSIFNAVLAAGGLQTFGQGVWAFFELPPGIEGQDRDIDKAILSLWADCYQSTPAIRSDYAAYAVGIVVSTGAVGSGPSGAPASVAEVDQWIAGGVQDLARDPLIIRGAGTLTSDTSGSSTAHERDRLTAAMVASTSGGMNQRVIACGTLVDVGGEWAAVSGSNVISTSNDNPWAPGDRIALAVGLWRDAVNASTASIEWGAEIAYTQDTEPP